MRLLGGNRLHLHANDSELRRANILKRMRAQWLGPDRAGRAEQVGACPAVQDDGVGSVTAYKSAPAENVEYTGPAVSMERRACTRRDPGIEDADEVILKQERVVLGGSHEGI